MKYTSFSAAVLLGFGVLTSARADTYTFLQPGFSQEVYGTAPAFMGGVAFAPDGDVWVTPCVFSFGNLRRFDSDTTIIVNGTRVHPLIATVSSNVGCGITNHPNGFLYSNTSGGVTRQDASTGAPAGGGFGPAGNALGIDVSPETLELVYVGSNGVIHAVDPDFTSTRIVSMALQNQFVDGLFFDPTGEFIFTATRSGGFRMSIIRFDDGSLVQHVPMTSEPDGIAFRPASPRFVVTSNTNGTMSRFDFPGDDFTQPPVVSVFASGGFRGEISDIGPDDCLYVPQQGTRFDNGSTSTDNSICRICRSSCDPVADFDVQGGVDIPVGTEIDDEYAGVGVRISGVSLDPAGGPGVFINRRGAPGSETDDLNPLTEPNFLTTSARLPFDPDQSDFGRIRFDFVDPITGAPRAADFVGLRFLDVEDSGFFGGRGNSFLRAIREDGSTVDAPANVAGDGQVQTLTIGSVGGSDAFVAAEAYVGDSGDSAAVDDLCFNLIPAAVELGCDGGPEQVSPGGEIEMWVGLRNNSGVRLPILFSMMAGQSDLPPRATILVRRRDIPPFLNTMAMEDRVRIPVAIPARVPSRLRGVSLEIITRVTEPTAGWDYARHRLHFVVTD